MAQTRFQDALDENVQFISRALSRIEGGDTPKRSFTTSGSTLSLPSTFLSLTRRSHNPPTSCRGWLLCACSSESAMSSFRRSRTPDQITSVP